MTLMPIHGMMAAIWTSDEAPRVHAPSPGYPTPVSTRSTGTCHRSSQSHFNRRNLNKKNMKFRLYFRPRKTSTISDRAEIAEDFRAQWLWRCITGRRRRVSRLKYQKSWYVRGRNNGIQQTKNRQIDQKQGKSRVMSCTPYVVRFAIGNLYQSSWQ